MQYQLPHHPPTQSIATTSNLIITMTVQHNPERRTKYRAVKRSDGLIVLQRPYQPVNSIPTFEKLTSSPSPKKTEKTPLLSKDEHNFAHIGCHLVENVEKEHCDLSDARRSRYNDAEDMEKELGDILASIEQQFDVCAGGEGAGSRGSNEFSSGTAGWFFRLSSIEQHPVDQALTPMQRFLSELEPWHSLGKEEVEYHLG
jgi:hypothetical protein